MEPTLHQGDLAVLWAQEDYDIGDVVAYKFDRAHVIHRIIERVGKNFVLKGDNKTLPDSSRPRQGEILGRMELLLPGGGNVVAWLRQPAALGSVVGMLGMLLVLADHRNGGVNRDPIAGHWGVKGGHTATIRLNSRLRRVFVEKAFRFGRSWVGGGKSALGQTDNAGEIHSNASLGMSPHLILKAAKMGGQLGLREEIPLGSHIYLVGRGLSLRLRLLPDERT